MGGALVAAVFSVGAVRSCAPARPPSADGDPSGGRSRFGFPGGGRSGAPADAAPRDLGPPPPPSVGWETEAEALAADLRGLLDGHARGGAYAEARAEAARRDLALFPPEKSRVRRMLLGGERERTWALAAVAARPEASDDLVRIVLRSQRPDDDEVVRLLGAEIVAALPAEVLSRHEDDLLRAFEQETNPLVFAVALPALERMEEPRLRQLLRAQVSAAGSEMLPVLVALAKDRLGAQGMEGVEETLGAQTGAGDGEVRPVSR